MFRHKVFLPVPHGLEIRYLRLRMKLKSFPKDELKDQLAAKAKRWFDAKRERLRELEREVNAPSQSPEAQLELMSALKDAHKVLSMFEARSETRDIGKSNIRPLLSISHQQLLNFMLNKGMQLLARVAWRAIARADVAKSMACRS